MEFSAFCFFYRGLGYFIGFIVSYIKQHTFNEVVEAAVFALGHLFETFYQVNIETEHRSFFLNCCFHSVIILIANIKQIYSNNKSGADIVWGRGEGSSMRLS